MVSKASLALTSCALLCVLAITGGCGNASTSAGYSSMAITSIAPAALPSSPTPVTITGGDFSQVVGTTCTVRWTAQTGAPFAGGSSSTAEITGTVVSPTTVTSTSPAAALCGAAVFLVDLEVILPSGAVARTAAGLVISFVPPTISGFAGASNFPAAIPTLFTLNGANLSTGTTANITWAAGSPIFAGGTSSTTVTVGNVSSTTTIDGTSPLAQVCGVPNVAATVTDITFSDGSCVPPGLAIPATFDAPTLTQLNGSGAPASVPSTIVLGSVTPDPMVLTGTGFGPNGSVATVDFGPPLSVSVLGLVVSDTSITGDLPTFTAPRLTADTTVDVTVTLTGGSCATTVGLANFVAPPTITTITNNRPPFDQTTPANPIPDTWLHCIATSTTVTGTGFDAGLTELFYDSVAGPGTPIGGGVLTADPSPAATPRTVTPPTTLTGWSPVDTAITNPTAVTLRLVNPDLQYDEMPGLTWNPTGVLPNVNAGPDGGNNSEMQISVNSNNPLNAAICAHDGGSGYTQMLHSYTMDGGLTWTSGIVGPPGSLSDDGYGAGAFRFDPMGIFDRFGNYYCVYGVTDPGTSNDFVVLHRSTDGGATFSSVTTAGFPVTTGLDRWTVAVGPDGINNRVTTHEQIILSCVDLLTDDIWVTAIFVAAGAGPNGEGGAISLGGTVVTNDLPAAAGRLHTHGTPSVGPSGELYVSYIEGDSVFFPPLSLTNIFIDPFTVPGGVSGTDVLVSVTFHSAFRVPIVPEFTRGKGVLPVHKVIRTGPYAGRIVIVWGDMTNPGLANEQIDVVAQHSDDNGATWSVPVAVHPGSPAYQFFPWIGTDPVTGHVYVGYYDTQRDAANNRAIEWYVVGSQDGVTWTPPLLVAQAPSDAGPAGGLNDMLEYNGVTVMDDCVYTCWADNSNFTGDNASGTLVVDGFDVLTSVLALDAD